MSETETPEVPEGTAPEGGKRNSWLTHVKKTMRAHKGKSFKAVLKMAKKTYKGGSAGGVASTASPLGQAGGRMRRGSKKTRKVRKVRGGRKH
jgi:hypothetical protein